MPAPAIGIDLGTTNSLAAYVDESGKPVAIAGDDGEVIVPSVVSVAEGGTVLVGRAARRRAVEDPRNTIFSVKRLMGKGVTDLTDLERTLCPFEFIAQDDKNIRIKIRDAAYTPEQISAWILREVAGRASSRLGEPVTKAVITVPAYFDEPQKQATMAAGRIAGLEVLRIVNEPTAASLAYGLDGMHDGVIAVYDLGGGTFDISILKIESGVFRVLATNGDASLGGDDFDRAIVNRLISQLADSGISQAALADPSVLQGLRAAAERAKVQLSAEESATIYFESSNFENIQHNIQLKYTLTRAEFEQLVAPLLDRTFGPCRRALSDAGIERTGVDAVVLVGGSTYIPLTRRRVEEFFGRKPYSNLNPMEVVALGAAVQARKLEGGFKNLLLLDVTPLSLGVETYGGAVDKVIARNTPIPARGKSEYTTFSDNQSAIIFNIVQGERELAKDCRPLGKLILRGLPGMPAGMPRVDVQFHIDSDGLLTVTATERRSGAAAKVEIVPKHGLTLDEITRLVTEAATHARDDFRAARLVTLRADAEFVLKKLDAQISRYGPALDRETMREIAEARDGLLDAMKGDSPDAIDGAHQYLEDVARVLVEVSMDAAAVAALKGKLL